MIDREKLAKLLWMMGSAHEGEVVNAARAADRLVRDAGLTWHEILGVEYKALESDDRLSDAQAVDYAYRARSRLTEWEQGFVESIRHWLTRTGRLSEKQRQVLDRIITKLGE